MEELEMIYQWSLADAYNEDGHPTQEMLVNRIDVVNDLRQILKENTDCVKIKSTPST